MCAQVDEFAMGNWCPRLVVGLKWQPCARANEGAGLTNGGGHFRVNCLDTISLRLFGYMQMTMCGFHGHHKLWLRDDGGISRTTQIS